MALTIKQENFCLAIVETGKPSESYRRAFNAAKMSDAAVAVEAAKLLKNPKIALRIEALRKPVIEAAQISLEQHLNDLKRLRDLALSDQKYGPAIQAEIARGKASGHYIDRVEHGNPGDFDNLTDDELNRKIADAERALGIAQDAIGTASASSRATQKAK